MLPNINPKFIAAPLTGNQLKEGRKKSAGRFRSAVRGPIDGCAGVSAQKSVAVERHKPRQSPAPGFGEKYWSLSGFPSHSKVNLRP